MDDLVKIFKALSDETRLRIIKLLEHGELCVCHIGAALHIIQPKVSFHLGVLKNSGLLCDRKHGKWIYYSLNESEIFKRFLLMSVAERISEKNTEEDRARLDAFIQSKKEGNVVPMSARRTGCCKG